MQWSNVPYNRTRVHTMCMVTHSHLHCTDAHTALTIVRNIRLSVIKCISLYVQPWVEVQIKILAVNYQAIFYHNKGANYHYVHTVNFSTIAEVCSQVRHSHMQYHGVMQCEGSKFTGNLPYKSFQQLHHSATDVVHLITFLLPWWCWNVVRNDLLHLHLHRLLLLLYSL